MSHDVSFRRKVIYVAAIALLLFPLLFIGQPASSKRGSGGVLARLRAEHGLSQAELGDIDPASESMKLATLGMRGVAALMLWQKANEYKMKENWDALSATLNQITKLQPNYVGVWEFQAHNLAYNISAEFDDYRLRYHWVKKGIEFLIGGTKYNRDNPRLLHMLGWVTGQKFGRADEHVQFRQLFREDDDFHDELSHEIDIERAYHEGRPDTWLVGRRWYLRAEQAVAKGKPLRGKSPLLFHASAPMSLINFASTIEEEGTLGEIAQRAWSRAGQQWAEYGRRDIPTSWGDNIRLAARDQVQQEVDALRQQLDDLVPGARERLKQERLAALSQAERDALEIPEKELPEDKIELYYRALDKTRVTDRDVAEQATEECRKKADRLVARLEERDGHLYRIRSYRHIVNYSYWEIRCDAEQTKTAVDAREAVYNAVQAHDKADLRTARQEYERAWKNWSIIFQQYPRLQNDVTADDLVKPVKRYIRLLQQLDKQLPADFPLRELMEGRDDQLDKLLISMTAEEDGPPSAPDAESPTTESPPADTAVPSAGEAGAGDSEDPTTSAQAKDQPETADSPPETTAPEAD